VGVCQKDVMKKIKAWAKYEEIDDLMHFKIKNDKEIEKYLINKNSY